MLVFEAGVLIERTLVGPAVLDQLDALHVALDRFWDAVDTANGPRPPAEPRMAFALGVTEIATNIIRHAYPSSGTSGQLEIRLRLYRDRLEAILLDRGQAFVEPPPAANTDAVNVPEHGLGLSLTRRILDRVDYTRDPRGINCWRLVKRV